MRRAYKDKSIIAVMIIIISLIIAAYLGYKTASRLSVDRSNHEVITSMDDENTPLCDTANKAVEVVSARKNEELDTKKPSVNASKQSSLEKAIEDLMVQTETE